MMKVNQKIISLNVLLLFAATFMVAGCDKREEATTATAPGTGVETALDDDIITTKIRSGLLADPVVKGLDPKVETHQGIVRLSGFVESQAQMERIVEIAHGVAGVKNVENKMNIRN
ncbi:transporter [Sulfuricaulis limicola]|uniref:Osmotically-inducible protein Y n=1 Tax=Sulfuricaulis limicola TaxID=1620215 RepID=A0A1B4XGY1_9GAMM|nr:BON domain-containing protein [Sulfuricaulis limicola]BAV34064.1 transporter [Sulfuricaulis limicola]